MTEWQKKLIRTVILLGWLALSGSSYAETFPELKKIISDQLLYPRDARYTIPSTLPSDTAGQAKNAEWLIAAQHLSKAGLVRLSIVPEKTILDGTEQSLDVVVPSMNLRYETTALNVVLGRWEIEVLRVANAGDVKTVYGKRRVIKHSRAYDPVVGSIPPKEAAKYMDQDVIWEISKNGASFNVVEKVK